MAYGVLVVEDEATLSRNIKRYLEQHGYEVRLAADAPRGLSAFEEFKPDLVLLDYHLPGGNGLEVLKAIRAVDRQVKVILMTAHGDVQVAVNAMKAGADDYVSKPVVLSELKLLVDGAVGQQRLQGALSYYRGKVADESGLDKIIGVSPAVVRLKERVAQLLEAERRLIDGPPPPALITGETGTGKELVARALHFDGPRRAQPFVEINCASLPAHLVESELLGFERGAFTDARERKIGLAEAAHGGTLFLDEIGDLELALQAKLLKLLEDRTVRRLGSVREREVDIRIIAATNLSLEQRVAAGQFRADLYFRLRVVTLEVPALRERGEDVLLLAAHMLATFARRYGKPGLRLGAGAAAALRRHDWPGNVRELRNAMDQAALLAAGDEIALEDLALARPASAPAPAPVPAQSPAGDDDTLTRSERGLISQALAAADGNVTRAAKRLGISRDKLRYRMGKHGLREDTP
jgi:two-component system, NtrC family, response regulator AtoC